jgi:DNA (cytosine-5)-methyltransferase 1
MKQLKLLDLFSGIGGFSLGLESTGYFKTIAFVEKDKFCQQVLNKNFKNIPIESEVRDVKGDKYAADIITGGFPCQPFSVAGKRRGTEDDRYLWDETIRIIRECKPRWFIGENVEGIINIQDGMVLRQVQDDLEKEGFQVQCLVIPASGIGAWHQRKRVWIVAHSDSNKNKNEITTSNGEEKKVSREHREKDNTSGKSIGATTNDDVSNSNSRLGKRETEQIQARGNTSTFSSEDVSYTDSIRHGRWSSEGCTNERWSFLSREQEGREMGSETSRCDVDVSYPNNKRCKKFNISKKSNKQIIHSRKYVKKNVRNTQSSRHESSINRQRQRKFWRTSEPRLQCKKTWWETQSSLCGVPNGISFELDKNRANRIKSLGNSIVPLIARELGLAIMKAEKDNG